MTVFERAFAVVIGAEGGYSNNPLDPGGETKFGISKRIYPALNIASLTLDDARAIYKRDYWDKVRGDDLPAPVALVVFDAIVNGGQPVRWMQGAARVAQDGVIGPGTLAAVANAKVLDLVTEINSQRLIYLTGLPTWRTFGLGWTRRVVHLGVAAVAFDTPDTVQPILPAPIVASLDDVKAAVREAMSERVAA